MSENTDVSSPPTSSPPVIKKPDSDQDRKNLVTQIFEIYFLI